MQITRSATSISWIPSDSIPGLLRLPMDKGVMHYDPPPPLTITDLEPMRRRGEFRFANILRARIHVEDGKIHDHGYAGGARMGLTPITAGPLRVMLPAKPNTVIRHSPLVTGDAVTFVQTAGGRPGFSFLKPSARWPFLVTRPFTIWTTIELTIRTDGSTSQRLAGLAPAGRCRSASPSRLARRPGSTWQGSRPSPRSGPGRSVSAGPGGRRPGS